MVAITSPYARGAGATFRCPQSAVVMRGVSGGQGKAAMRSRGREKVERPVEILAAQFLDRGSGAQDQHRRDPPPGVDLPKQEPIERELRRIGCECGPAGSGDAGVALEIGQQ